MSEFVRIRLYVMLPYMNVENCTFLYIFIKIFHHGGCVSLLCSHINTFYVWSRLQIVLKDGLMWVRDMGKIR